MLRRPTLAALTLAVSVTLAQAHFVFVLPAADGHSATAVMSEELAPDTEVPINVIAGLKLNEIDAGGTVTPLKPAKAEHAMTVDLPAPAKVLFGVADLGVVQHGKSPANWLTYYPKTVFGDPLDPKATLGDKAPLELTPVGKPGQMRLRFTVDGKPVSKAEVMVVPEHGNQDALDTDADGLTPVIEQTGRVGFWAKQVIATPGELNGKPYQEVRHYATLVIDVPDAAAVPTTAPSAALLPVEKFATMPQPASSFGAVATGGWLYVYGGHVVDTHTYSTKSVSGQFHRLNLADGKTWETLPGGPSLQGMNLAAYDGKIIRVGGMQPQNKDGEAEDVRSVATAAIYDPAAKAWTSLPPLPQPRSSHDMAVLGDKLYVVGGWTLDGTPGDADWPDSGAVLDLKADKPQWQPLPQPFKRRALIAAAFDGKLYAIGGFDETNDPSLKVDVYDPATNAWTAGPALPKPQTNGFGPAAVVIDHALYASVGDGSLLRLNPDGRGWTRVAAATPRIVHRLAADGTKVLILGGARGPKQQNLIEAVDVGPKPLADATH